MEAEKLYRAVAYLMEKIESRATPANDIINDYMQSHRYLSPEERKCVLDLIWKMIRSRTILRHIFHL